MVDGACNMSEDVSQPLRGRAAGGHMSAGIRIGTAIVMLTLQTSVLVVASGTWLLRQRHAVDQHVRIHTRALQSQKQKDLELVDQVTTLTAQITEGKSLVKRKQDIQQKNTQLKAQRRANLKPYNTAPFKTVSGGRLAHWLPDKYGQILEKTIWSYYYHPTECPSAAQCKLPDYMQLAIATMFKNRGSFRAIFLHHDHIDWYVHRTELPVHFEMLSFELQFQALMNALLARYGGVAIEPSTLLLRPLDDYWDEMLAKGATFRGYTYRVNGDPWRWPVSTATWFLMARREGIFSTAVRNQVISMGDRKTIYTDCSGALGDMILTPILAMYDYKLPRCRDDTSIASGKSCCPDYNQTSWWNDNIGSNRNDTKLLLRDPRDGPIFPFVDMGLDMEMWGTTASSFPEQKSTDVAWDKLDCKSPKDCWKAYVLDRFHKTPLAGEANLLSFVRISGEQIAKMSRSEIFMATDSYFYQLLRIAGYDFSKAQAKMR